MDKTIMDPKHINANPTDEDYDAKIKRLLGRWSGVKTNVHRKPLSRTTVKETDHQFQPEILVDASGDFIEEKRKTKVIAKTQVLVIGGGPAGLCAAIAAARAGVETMIVERFGCFGGVITTVGMETVGWYRYEGTEDSEGIGREMERLARDLGGASKFPYNDSECLDAEQFKMIADRLIEENNIRPRLHTTVVDCIVVDGVVKGVICESKSGREAILADRIIDCSGDADVAHFAGVSYTILPLEEQLGVSTIFNMSGVDKVKFMKNIKENPATYADWDSGEWKQECTGKEKHLGSPYFNIEQTDQNVEVQGSWSSISEQGEATNLNLVYMKGVDCTNVEDLTNAEIEGRKRCAKVMKTLKDTIPGFEEAKLRNFAMTLGTRDSRKICARYNLTGSDVAEQGRFQDSIGVFPEFIDGYNILILPTSGRYFQVPYGCMVPEEVDNLLVAGRCVSGDMVSHAAIRNIMCCCVTGQGAGTAAAISILNGQSTSNVDIKLVQIELKKQGARIE